MELGNLILSNKKYDNYINIRLRGLKMLVEWSKILIWDNNHTEW